VALEVAQATMRKVKQNLFWAFIYNMLGIPLAAGLLYPFVSIIISPELAGLLMAISSITVTLNTLLLKRFKPSIRHTDKPARGTGGVRLEPVVAVSGH
jgi:P-type Cu+ transporter